MMIEIDENGNMIRSTLGNTANLGTNIDILQSKQTSADRMIISGVTINNMGGNRQTKMGMIKFQ